MAFASWFRVSNYSFASVLKAAPRRRSPRPQPLRSRLQLEYLEDRMLLSTAAANQFGGLNNPSTNFNTQEVGIVLPQQGAASPLNNALGITQLANSLPLSTLGAQADLMAQGHLNDQFRAFSVNSEGQGNQAQYQQQQILFDAYGFGSGAQPNAPWKPAAYNLGLANHQYGYATQSDNGFQQVPPWYHSSMQPTRHTQPQDEPLASEEPDSSLVQDKMSEGQQKPQQDEQNSDRWNEKLWEDARLPQRGDPDVEKALFALTAPTNDESNTRSSAVSFTEKATEEEGIPSSLWLSALAPAQFAALVVGLPAVEAPVASGEVASPAGATE